MVCRMVHGRPWLGKETQRAKTLIILGEGAAGITQRIRAWCDFYGGDYEKVWEWVSFVGQFNINADDQLAKVQKHARDAELVILDTYAMTSGVESEDDAALQSITLNRARSINPDAALFFTHHPRKADEDSDKPVMLDFYADWCVSCREMERFTFTDPGVAQRMAGMLLVQADVTANNADDRALLKRFRLFGPPGIMFFEPGGKELPDARVVGFQDAKRFTESLDRVLLR